AARRAARALAGSSDQIGASWCTADPGPPDASRWQRRGLCGPGSAAHHYQRSDTRSDRALPGLRCSCCAASGTHAPILGHKRPRMIYLQIAANGLVLGGLYACIAVGFSLVWGVLNVINILHGSFIVLGSYVAYFCYVRLGIHPFASTVIAGAALFGLGYLLQAGIINRVIA